MEEKKKLIITIAVVVFVNIVFVGLLAYQFSVLGVGPLKGQDSLMTKIEKKTGKLEELKQRVLVEMPKRNKEKKMLEADDKEARQLLPEKIIPEELFKFIYAKAELALIDLEGIEAKSSRKRGFGMGTGGSKPYEEQIYSMKLRGSYDELSLFINYMENFSLAGATGPQKRLFAVKDLKISAEKQGIVEGGRHEIVLDMSTYKYKNKSSAEAAF